MEALFLLSKQFLSFVNPFELEENFRSNYTQFMFWHTAPWTKKLGLKMTEKGFLSTTLLFIEKYCLLAKLSRFVPF